MYMVVLWCKRRKSGKTPPFSPMFQPICMQMCPLHIIREGKASKHAQSKLLIFYPFYLVSTWFLLEKRFGPLLRSYIQAFIIASYAGPFIRSLVRVGLRQREFGPLVSLLVGTLHPP